MRFANPYLALRALEPEISHYASFEQGKTTWNDLPVEVLICIAKAAIVPQESGVSQHGKLDEADATFGAINKSARQAFFEAIKQNYVLVELRFYTSINSEVESSFLSEIRRVFSSSRSRNLFTTSLKSGLGASSVVVKLYEDKQSFLMSKEQVTLCASPRNTTLLKSLLLPLFGRSRLFTKVVIDSSASQRGSIVKTLDVVEEVGSAVCGIESADVNVLPSVPSSLDVATNICAQMVQKAEYEVMLEFHQSHLQVIKNPLRTEDVKSLGSLTSAAALELFAFFRRFPILPDTGPRALYQRSTYIAIIFKTLATYLFQHANTREDQSHHLLDGDFGYVLLRECIKYSDPEQFTTISWDKFNKNDQRRNLFAAIVDMLQSRAELELALARTTLTPGKTIGPHVRRTANSQDGKIDAVDHLRLAQECRDTLSMFALWDNDWDCELKLAVEVWNKTQFYQWLESFTCLAEEIEEGIRRRVPRLHQEILFDPMPQAMDILCLSIFPNSLLRGRY